MECVSEHACFGGTQGFYRHQSSVISLPMQFAVYQPPQPEPYFEKGRRGNLP
jgi:S-formylglutathione hydrolase